MSSGWCGSAPGSPAAKKMSVRWDAPETCSPNICGRAAEQGTAEISARSGPQEEPWAVSKHGQQQQAGLGPRVCTGNDLSW